MSPRVRQAAALALPAAVGGALALVAIAALTSGRAAAQRGGVGAAAPVASEQATPLTPEQQDLQCKRAREELSAYLVAPKTLAVEHCLTYDTDSGRVANLRVEAQNIYGAMIVGRFRLFFTVPDPAKLRMYGVQYDAPSDLTLLRHPSDMKPMVPR